MSKNHIIKNLFIRSSYMITVAISSLFLTGFISINNYAFASIDSQMKAAGWQEITFDSLNANHFTLVQPASTLSEQEVRLTSDDSVSVAYFPFDKGVINLAKTPYLAFEWKRYGDAVSTDLSKKGDDDRILSVYLAFAYQPERASLKEKLGRPFLEAKQGKDAPARLLTYLWGGRPATDDWFENPYTGKAGYMKILSRPDEPEGVWLSHKVNVAADFEARFGYPPPRLLYIAVSADTDDTKSSLTAHLRALRFSAE